jgi:uncharacterized protein (DUF1501 family)
MDLTRRHFLRMAGGGLGSAALATLMDQFTLSTALAGGGGYKALVCIFLAGGNDGNNTVVPLDNAGYNDYNTVRGASGLAIPQNQLLPIQPGSFSTPFGLHPNLGELQTLFQQGKLAVVCNVGPLIQPMTRQQYRDGSRPKPLQLFSHSNQVQEWQSARADVAAQNGWGGRTADRFPGHPSGFPMITSVAGSGLFTIGQTTRPLAIAPAPTGLNQVLMLTGFGTNTQEMARRDSFNYLRTVDTGTRFVAATSDLTQKALDISQVFTTDPTLNTVFPNTTLGNQLKQVAKVMKVNRDEQSLQLPRQIFFCSLGGFDTHQTEINRQGTLLTQLSKAMKAFYDATVELGLDSSVTTFTMSDFGRTLQPSGSGGSVGSDHGWGNHQFVMGSAVRGTDFYGVAGPNGTVYPTLQLGGDNDTDTRGRWIPTGAVEQYAATLATWYGLSASDLNLVFPLLPNFASANLGFLG